MTRETRVLALVKLPPPLTGQSVSTREFIDILERNGIRVDIVNLSFATLFISRKRLLVHAMTLLRRYWSIRGRRLGAGGNDCAYIGLSPSRVGHMRNLFELLLVAPRGARIVGHIHNGNFPERLKGGAVSLSYRLLMKRVDQILVCSQALMDEMARLTDRDRVRLVRYPIRARLAYDDEEARNRIERRSVSEEFSVLYLSNMIESKGYWDVLAASDRLTAKPKPRFVFAGQWVSAEAEHEFRRAAERGRAVVEVLGAIVDEERIRSLLDEADVLVLPTYYREEGQPIAIIEALNAGIPVIATAHAGIPEIVVDDVNGYLIGPRSPDEIVRSIEKLMDRSNWREKAFAARRIHKTCFDEQEIARRVIDAFTPGAFVERTGS